VKKLLLLPVVLTTVVLAYAFIMPATAANVLRSLAPAAHLSLPSVISAGSGNEVAARPAEPAGNPGSAALPGAPSSPGGSSSTRQDSTSRPSITVQDRGHAVATAGRVNCGRFGGGFHGGKHLDVCPNPVYPLPANQ
jgi:hypothetical protein